MNETWDCIVVGAGAAGLSAALALGRARRRTLVVDAGRQSNRVAHGVGGLLGHDGRPPAELYAKGRAELAAYPSVELRDGEVVRGERLAGATTGEAAAGADPAGAGAATGDGAAFLLELADGTRETTRRVLLATGMDYRRPDLPGVEERWGRSVFHCPFCHGWEVRERPLGVLDRGATGVHRALLLRAWSDDVTLLADGPAELDDEQAAQLRAAGVTIDERPVAELRGVGEELSAIAFADGGERPLGGLLVAITTHQRSDLAAQLGAVAAEPGMVAADALEVDPRFATSAAGVSAAGDVSAQMQSVPLAIAAGTVAAAMLVGSLMTEPVATPA